MIIKFSKVILFSILAIGLTACSTATVSDGCCSSSKASCSESSSKACCSKKDEKSCSESKK